MCISTTKCSKTVLPDAKKNSETGFLRLLLPLALWLACGSADGQTLTVLRNLGMSDGYTPYGNLILTGNVLYGTSLSGGSAGKGSVFKINTDGSGYTLLKNFDSAGPNSPMGRPVLSGGTLYGSTLTDGTDAASRGAVFKINTDGSGYTVLKHFASTNGAGPHGGLTLSGATLYGTTYYGGVWDLGTVFKKHRRNGIPGP